MATRTKPTKDTGSDQDKNAETQNDTAALADNVTPGGRYQLADGSFVDANGKPIKD